MHSHIGKRIIEGGLNVVSQQIRAEWCCCPRRLRHRSLNVTRAGGSHRPTILFARLFLIPDARFATAEGIIMYLDGPLLLTSTHAYDALHLRGNKVRGGGSPWGTCRPPWWL